MKTFALAALLAVAAPASAAWHRIDSPNFIVVGDVSVRELRAIATKFEGFQEVLRRVTPTIANRTPVPTVVVVFASDEAFTPFKPTYQGRPKPIAGFTVPGREMNLIAMVDARDASDRVIFHEYTHAIVANGIARIPLWLNEGLADFYSTFALMDDGRRAQIGRPVLEHLRLLNGSVRVPLTALLKADATSPLYNEDNRLSDFYAESWALTHMLLSGQPSRVAELSDYLQRVNSGNDEVAAWEQVFGAAKTENALRQYVQRPAVLTTIIEFPEKVTAVPLVETALSPATAASFLALLEARRTPDRAAALLAPALKQEPDNELAQAAMATIELARRDAPKAIARVMAMAPSADWFAAYDAAETLIEAAGSEPRTEALPAALTRATTLFEQVQRAHADLPNVLAALAQIEALAGGTPTPLALDRIARARSMSPGRVEYALTQAELYADAGDFVRARAVIGPLMTPVYPENVRNAARRLMGALVDLQAQTDRGAARSTSDQGSLPSARGRSVAVPSADTDPPRASGPRSAPRPDYRLLQAGEQRLEGTLEAIECASGKPALFRVRTASGIVELEGRMAEVQFVTFRDDLTGGVACGPRTPMRVYVTWREGPPPRGKVVVAVEFLPKD